MYDKDLKLTTIVLYLCVALFFKLMNKIKPSKLLLYTTCRQDSLMILKHRFHVSYRYNMSRVGVVISV